jgi:hypothetical protein
MPERIKADMKRKASRLVLLSGVCLALGVGSLSKIQAAGVAIFDSLSGSTITGSSGDAVGANGATFASGSKMAYEFLSPATGISGNGLNIVTVNAAVYSFDPTNPSSPTPGDFTLSIYNVTEVTPGSPNPASDVPGISLGTSATLTTKGINDTTVNANQNLWTTTFTLSQSLQSSTPYYFVISYVAGGYTLAPWSTTTPAFPQAATLINSTDTSWFTQASAHGAAFSLTAVPEPQAYAMLAGLGLMGFATFRRFRK